MVHDLQYRLNTLAARVDAGLDLKATAEALRELADRHPVQLPEIRPDHDDLGHWRQLTQAHLLSENGADAWNLAAGLHVERERRAAREVSTVATPATGAARSSP